jgi:uncharacterized protein (DUF1330 family)
MSAYLIFVREKTLDAQESAIYSKEVPATLAGHPAKRLAVYGAHEDLEGAPTEGSAIFEFPTGDAAKAWYNSLSYRQVREHRFKGAKFHVTLVQGG